MGNFTLEIFAVDKFNNKGSTSASRTSFFVAYLYLEVFRRFQRDCSGFTNCSKDHAGGCAGMVRFKQGHFLKSSVEERICNPRVHPVNNSAERDGRVSRSEVSEVRETPGWERIRVKN